MKVICNDSTYLMKRPGVQCVWVNNIPKEENPSGKAIEILIYELVSKNAEEIECRSLIGVKPLTNEEWRLFRVDYFFPEHFGRLIAEYWYLKKGTASHEIGAMVAESLRKTL